MVVNIYFCPFGFHLEITKIWQRGQQIKPINQSLDYVKSSGKKKKNDEELKKLDFQKLGKL